MADEYLLSDANRREELIEGLKTNIDNGPKRLELSRLAEIARLKQEAVNLRAEWKERNMTPDGDIASRHVEALSFACAKWNLNYCFVEATTGSGYVCRA